MKYSPYRIRFLFAEFSSAEEANHAMAVMQGLALDKDHKLVINKFTDIEKFASMDDAYVEPQMEEFKSRVYLSIITIFPRHLI